MRISKIQLAIIALIIANIIWGATPPIFKWSLEQIEPFTLGFLRFLLAAAILLPFTIHKLKIAYEDIDELFLISFVGMTLHIGFFLFGLQYAPSINVPVIGSAGPVFLIIGSMLFLKEKPKKKVVIGTLISLAGVLLIITRTIFEGQMNGSIIGNILFLLSTVSGIAHFILLKRITHKYTILTITFWTFAIGALLFLPLMLTEISYVGLHTQINARSVIGIVFGAVFASVIAWLLLTYALKQVHVSEVGIFTYIDPIATALVAFPLLNETITVHYFFAAMLVFSGIFISEGRINYHPLLKLARGFKSII